MLPLALLLLLAGGFDDFLASLKRNFPVSDGTPNHTPTSGWTGRMAFLTGEKVVHVAPGIVVIGGEVMEFGSIIGMRRYAARILAVCGPEGWRVGAIQADLPSPVPARFAANFHLP